MLKKNFSFIEAPIYQGQKHFGVSLGPSFLKQMLLDQNYHFHFLSLLVRQSTRHVQTSIYEELSYLVEREMRRKKLIFIGGGDHSLSIGSVQGLLRCNPDLKVLWIDAHGDVNTTESSLTQSFHGMPLSFLLGLDPFFEASSWFEEKLKPENLIYFGLRDLDMAEKLFLDSLHIQHYSADTIAASNKDALFEKIQKDLIGQQVHISLDVDVFDPSIAPATGIPVAKGLSFLDVSSLIEKVLSVSKVSSYEYVELNPQIFKNTKDVLHTGQLGIDIFNLILKKHKQTEEVLHGFNDRYGDSKKSGLYDPYFQLEEQSSSSN